MGYFSNSTEGMDYEQSYCESCVHYDDCSVLVAHQLFQGDPNPPVKGEQAVLDLFIERDDIVNKKCTMHYPIPETDVSIVVDSSGAHAVDNSRQQQSHD